MIPARLLPPAQRPPHDPTALILTSRKLWDGALLREGLCLDSVTGQVRLDFAPDFRRSLSNSNGSFGGLVLPGNVAIGNDGGVYLLDRKTATLKKFDPCDCRFLTMPCMGGVGGKPRQLRNPGGIGICAGRLFVCDTGVDQTDAQKSDCARTEADLNELKRENHRLSVFLLRGFELLGEWKPPAWAYIGPDGLQVNPWTPFDVDFDRHGHVYVTDPRNGCIHRFSSQGVWLRPLRGLGRVSHLAIDCKDRLYVFDEDTKVVKMLDQSGNMIDNFPTKAGAGVGKAALKRPEEFSSRFHKPPLDVDPKGRMHLGDLCLATCCTDRRDKAKGQTAEFRVFDLSGDPVDVKLDSAPRRFIRTGTFTTDALDSEVYRCTWHRAVFSGKLQPGTAIVVETITSEIKLSSEEVSGLFGQQSLSTRITTNGKELSLWDSLVRSQAGRYLWLKLTLCGNGELSPAIDLLEVEFPRISLSRYLPAVFREEPVSADFTDRFLSLFDTTFRSIESTLDNLASYFDPCSTPAERRREGIDFLTWLASWVGITFDRHWSEQKRRRFLHEAGKIFPLRGTPRGLWLQLLIFLGIEPARICCANDQPISQCNPIPPNCIPIAKGPCHWEPPPLILEHFRLRRWLFLGAGRLDAQSELWGKRIVNRSQLNANAQADRSQLITKQDPLRDPFHVYAHKFSVFVPACLGKSESMRKGLKGLIDSEKPAHTSAQIWFVEPRFRIGFQSSIGFDAVVGRYPAGITLDGTRLGKDSVLTAPSGMQGKPALEVGSDARIGSTTVIT